MSSASARLLFYVCGIYLQLENYLMTIVTVENRTSWVDAFGRKPNDSLQLISPLLALNLASKIRQHTDGPVYINGFTYGDINKGGLIQMTNASDEHSVFCANGRASGNGFSYETLPDKYRYEEGRSTCSSRNETYTYFITISTLNMIAPFLRQSMFWMDYTDIDIPKLVQENKTIYCMVLDLTGEGRLMLENCSRPHKAAYIYLAENDEYKPTIKQYRNSSSLPFYNPNKSTKGTSTLSPGTSATIFSTNKNSSIFSTKPSDESGTLSPDLDGNTDKDLDDSIQDIFGMNPDIFYAIAGVASVVVATIILCLCCFCCKSRKSKSSNGLALSDDYSNPVDSIAMKDPEMGAYSTNGVYANPQDSITPVKAKKRDSIEEGVYDVTFTSGQRKPSANPSNQPVNAYSHVTIAPQGGATIDDPENHYDSTSHVKQQQQVLVSQSHSENTYGEVQIKQTT